MKLADLLFPNRPFDGMEVIKLGHPRRLVDNGSIQGRRAEVVEQDAATGFEQPGQFTQEAVRPQIRDLIVYETEGGERNDHVIDAGGLDGIRRM